MRLKLMWIFVIAIVLLSAACETKNASLPVPIAPPNKINDPKIGALTDTVGNPTTVRRSNKLSKEQAIATAKDYLPQTGIWFQGEGFNILSSISQGTVKAGETVSAALSWLPEGCSVRFQLTSRDNQGKRIALIVESIDDISHMIDHRIDFQHKIPDTPNTNYMLSIEILNKEGVVEDTLLSPLFVPLNKFHARLFVQPSSLVQGMEETKLNLFNAGPTNLFFGYGYEIYRKESKSWVLVPPDKTTAVPAIGISIPPGQTYHEKVLLPASLEPGLYRIVKSIGGDAIDATARLAADFEIR